MRGLCTASFLAGADASATNIVIGGLRMKYLKTILMAVALLTFTSILYAHNQTTSRADAFSTGYAEGYIHGESDREMGVDFNYRHDSRFRTGVSNNSYLNAIFRTGYKEGYSDAYSGKSSREITIYESDDSKHYISNDETTFTSTPGFVTVYSDENFDGRGRDLEMRRYSELDGNWEDDIESIQIDGNVRVVLFDDEDFEGQSLVLERSISDLEELNFKDRAESMIVEPNR
jgi:hypothetical protein